MNNGNTPQSGFGSGMDHRPAFESGGPGTGTGTGMGEGSGGGMSEGLDRVRGMASKAGEKLMDTAEHQKRAGADYMTGIAEAVRRAASEFDDPVPQAAQYIRLAADQMETMSDSIRRRDMGQMLSDVQSFARRQPTAFLGLSLLAGFAAMRFLRSTSPGPSSDGGPNGRFRREEDDLEDDGRYGAAGGSARSGMSGSGTMPSGTGM